jgi:rare lipoprotein A (peptidoglycan hydrolase)
MRPSPRVLAASCALAATASGALVAGSAAAQPDAPTPPTASAAAPSTQRERLNVHVGQTAVVAGRAAAGRTVVLERRSRGRWRTLDRARVDATGRYRLRHETRRPSSARVRVRVAGTHARRALGRLNVYRRAKASWYGPGLYGNHLACGGRLSDAIRGVAHKTLPCGTRVTLRKGDRIVRARVVDRGPFAAGREFDLTPAVKRALGFGSTGTVEVALEGGVRAARHH